MTAQHKYIDVEYYPLPTPEQERGVINRQLAREAIAARKLAVEFDAMVEDEPIEHVPAITTAIAELYQSWREIDPAAEYRAGVAEVRALVERGELKGQVAGGPSRVGKVRF